MDVRAPGPDDQAALAALLAEMQRHYGAPVPPEEAADAAELLCTLAPEGFNPRTLVALDGGDLVGSCVMNVMLPAAQLRRSLYIRDLYVCARARRRGVGQALVRAATAMARDGGFCALDWTTDATNRSAQSLYDRGGGQVVARTYYRIPSDSFPV